MRVVVAQSDVVTAYGWGIAPLWQGLLAGCTAIRDTDRFAQRRFISNQAAMVEDLDVGAGETRVAALLRRLLLPLAGRIDPCTPLLLATTIGEIEHVERSVFRADAALAAEARPAKLFERVKRLLGLRGQGFVLSSACASSTAALARAASMVRSGRARAVLVVACDAVSEFIFSGFSTLAGLSGTPARPFDAGRDGLSLGEAAAWAMVCRTDAPEADEAGAWTTELLGWGNTTDAVHMTAPDRNAVGLTRAIAGALAMAGRAPDEVAFIAAHGTGTTFSDAMEMCAFRRVIPTPRPVFSTKGGTGHTFGAAGLVQALVAAHALRHGIVPPSVGLVTPDTDAAGWARAEPVAIAPGATALSTSAGFGGVNSALLLAAAEPSARVFGPGGIGRTHAACVSEIHGVSRHVRAVAWCSPSGYGFLTDDGRSLGGLPLDLSNGDVQKLVRRPVKYLPRFTSEARRGLCAASLALAAMPCRPDAGAAGIGIVGVGYDGWIEAERAYFADYLANGRCLGRGNLFIYTLPTSPLSEIAIALGLKGPTLHLGSDTSPIRALLEETSQILADGEADGMLAVCSDERASVCFALAPDEPRRRAVVAWPELERCSTELAARFQTMVCTEP